MRRNPFPVYDQMRSVSPVFNVPPPFNMWMVFDFENVKRVVNDHETFSSRVPAPDNWFLFFDPPQHSKLRALISRAFTPKSIASLEGRIRKLSSQLLDDALAPNQLDLAAKYSVPLPMKVIAEMIGIPASDWTLFRDWSDTMLKLSYSMRGMEKDAEAANALAAFRTVTLEMDAYLANMIEQRRTDPCDDLLTRLIEAEVDGEKLKHNEILGFFQLLIIGGQETTTNLINNSMLCFMENPDQLALLRKSPELLPSAIEEVLRYRSPLQWLMRTPKQDVALNGQTIPAGNLVLAIVGSANRDAKQFQNPNQFDITRTPNPHLAFGHGIHACLGAALSRMEARVALQDILARLDHFELASQQPWEPRKALHVHGPAALPLNIRIR
ncbi:MAG: cypA9 [Verrucomicrobiales bacterium]|nr:cypA9 [Verrucomicrobiales bacterium]